MTLEGRVKDTMDSRAFVDAGVGRNGLAHISQLEEG